MPRLSARRVERAFGGIDILVLNASVQLPKPWAEITAEAFATQVNVNFRASLLLIQRFVPHMAAQKRGRVITIGSVQEAKPHPNMLVYSSTKAAQTMMVKSMAAQLAPQGITLNNVAPGVVLTDRNTSALADPVYAQKVKNLIPMGHFAQTRDCVGTVLLLASDAGRYITGQSILVDGGKAL